GVGDLHEPAADARPRERRAEQVLALVQRARPQRGPHVIAHEFQAHVAHDRLVRTDRERLLPRTLEILGLADVGAEAHDLAAIGLGDPAHGDRGIEAAGICEYDFANHARRYISAGASRVRAGRAARHDADHAALAADGGEPGPAGVAVAVLRLRRAHADLDLGVVERHELGLRLEQHADLVALRGGLAVAGDLHVEVRDDGRRV